MNKKSITILVVCLIVTVLSVSLAYYTTRIIGTGKNVSVNAKELTINFDNNNEIAEGIIEPGWSSTNTFSVENKSKNSFTYDIVLKNYKNTTKTNGYLVYKITSTNGYNMTEYKDMSKDGDNTYDLVIARGITIETGSSNKQSYTLEIKYLDSDEDQSIDMGSTVTGSLYIVESTTNQDNPYTKGTLGYQIMEDNSNIKTRTDFSTTYTDVNIGTMYKSTEDDTDVYYFAGDARNNWVKFGTWQEDKSIIIGRNAELDKAVEFESLDVCNKDSYYNYGCTEMTIAKKGDPMYWRIIRTNSDGSIRLLYTGTSPYTNTGYIGFSRFNLNRNNPMYVGYMYGTSGTLENNRTNTNESTIKKYIDTWYSKYFLNYTKYLSTSAVYCNDRETNNYNLTSFDFNTKLRQFSPTYNCTNSKDSFSVSNSEAKLTYPVGLMTSDEIIYSGGVYQMFSSGYYFRNANKGNVENNREYYSATGLEWWWTMTPIFYDSDYARNYVMVGYGGDEIGQFSHNYVGGSRAVRPVISLKSDVLYKSGDGSADNPYEIIAEPVNTYTVSITVNNGSGTSTVLVEEGKDIAFTVTPNDGYKAELETDTCGGTLSGNTYTISNVTSNKTCSITFKKNGTSLATLIQTNAVNENGYRYEGANPNNYIYMVKNGSNELWRIIGLFPDGTSGENVIRVRKVGYEEAAYDSNSTNHWPKTTLYTTLSRTYSLINYKNTVNYKMYLGGVNNTSSYTVKDIYDMERMLNSKGAAGATSQASYSSATTFTGSVGLMYPSDYGYAVLASDCARTIKPYNYHEPTTCHDNNWLYQGSSAWQWLISPYHSYANGVFIVGASGYVYGDEYSYTYVTNSGGSFSPVMALSADVMVTGSGTQSDPYVMTN